ncbi:MAG TPA: hypothetical protein VJP40_06370 [bacterium]|nr:hypothetical protein [bacterium]
MVSSVEAGYNRHLWGREIAATLQIPLLYLSSAGQYRVNLGLYREAPEHPAFAQEGGRRWYRSEGLAGRSLQRIFVPTALRREAPEVAHWQELRRSGSGLQTVAGYGLQVPSLLRLAVNGRTLFDPVFWRDASSSPGFRAAIVSDSLGLAGGLVQTHFYNRGLRSLQTGAEGAALGWFRANHRLHLASGAFQMSAGLLRLGFEIERISRTGEFRPSQSFFASLDAAAGAGGIWYSRYLLGQSAGLSAVRAQNDVLMGLAHLPRGMRWGMRSLNLAGNAVGFGLSFYAFCQAFLGEGIPSAARQHRMTSAGLGMLGSALMMGSALLVTPATAPLAGLLMIGGLGAFAVQAIWFD